MADLPQPRSLYRLLHESFRAAFSAPVAASCLAVLQLLHAVAVLFTVEQARQLDGVFTPWMSLLVAVIASPFELLALTVLAHHHCGVRLPTSSAVGRAFALFPAYLAWSLLLGFLDLLPALLLGSSVLPVATVQKLLAATIVIEGAGVRSAWRALICASRFQALGFVLAFAMPLPLHPVTRWMSLGLGEFMRVLPFGEIPAVRFWLTAGLAAGIAIPLSLFLMSWTVAVVLDGLVREQAAKERTRRHHDRLDTRPGG
ncbi:MAG: hypothetical protein JNJ88_06130 [Planctomycetes bacterium]|nr:hypothetical protein [Planctomycetota bacterium]